MTEKTETPHLGLMSVYDDPDLMRAEALISVAADIFYKHGYELLCIVAEDQHCYSTTYKGDYRFMAQPTLKEHERFLQNCEDSSRKSGNL